MSVSSESVGGPITRPEESYEVYVSDCDLGTSNMNRSWPTGAVEPLDGRLQIMKVLVTYFFYHHMTYCFVGQNTFLFIFF
jgi:hypothetical protein